MKIMSIIITLICIFNHTNAYEKEVSHNYIDTRGFWSRLGNKITRSFKTTKIRAHTAGLVAGKKTIEGIAVGTSSVAGGIAAGATFAKDAVVGTAVGIEKGFEYVGTKIAPPENIKDINAIFAKNCKATLIGNYFDSKDDLDTDEFLGKQIVYIDDRMYPNCGLCCESVKKTSDSPIIKRTSFENYEKKFNIFFIDFLRDTLERRCSNIKNDEYEYNTHICNDIDTIVSWF